MGTMVRTASARTARMRAKLIAQQSGICAICGEPIGDDLSLDHIVPRSLGGKWTDWNLQATHTKCNQQKGASYIAPPKPIGAIVFPPPEKLLQFIAANPGDTIQTIAIGVDAVLTDTYRNLGHLYTHGKVRFEKPTWTDSEDYLFWKWYAE